MMCVKLLPLTLAIHVLLAGCGDPGGGPAQAPPASNKPVAGPGSGNSEEEAKVRTNLARLSPEDRKLAEEQKFCAVERDNRLGAMGVPLKVMVNDQPVFLCCKGCKEEAVQSPEKTLASVKELRSAATGARKE